VGRLEHRHRIARVGAGGDANAAYLRRQCVGNVVTVQIQRRDHVVLVGPQQDLLQKRIGTTRTVIVTPAAYVVDNRVTLDGIQQLGASNTRGVAVLHPTVTDAELKVLSDGGIRGIRFTVFDPASAAVSIDMIEPLAKRVADLGWHVQIHMRGDQIVENAALLERLPTQVVFDHMARLPQPAPLDHPAYAIVRRMLDKGRTWMKLSGAYMDTNSGAPTYADKVAVAQAYPNSTVATNALYFAAEAYEAAAKPRQATQILNQIYRRGGKFFVCEEIGTMNGTFVNSERVETGVPVEVKPGDELQFGLVKMAFHGE